MQAYLCASDITSLFLPNLVCTKKHANHIVQLTESGLTQGARVYNPCGIGITLNSKGGGMGANTGLYLIKNRVRRLMPFYRH
jgi:hypothetical protein